MNMNKTSESSLAGFYQAVEQATGFNIKTIQNTHVCEMRRIIEAKHGRPMEVRSYTGVTTGILSSAEINRQFEKALKRI